MTARVIYPKTPSAGVPCPRNARRGAQPPHATSLAWWLLFTALLCAALLVLS